MHSLIVALLCLTLSVDTAKACWWRRHHATARNYSPALPGQPLDMPVGTPVANHVGGPACCLLGEGSVAFMAEADFVVVVEQHDHTLHDHTLFDSDGVDSEVVVSAGVDTDWVGEQAETSAEPDQVVRGREEPTAADQSATAADTVVVHGPTFVVDAAPAAPEPASVVAAQPMPVQAASPAVLPNPVVTEELLPDRLPATAGPEEPATIPQPLEPNLFDLYDDTEGNAASDDATLPADEAATEEPEETPPAASEADPEAAFFTPREPMRRWTNEAGTHQAQGWLVELRADRVRILKVNGRHTTVARESLSSEDRDYVSAVNDRLSSDHHSAAASTTTAGL